MPPSSDSNFHPLFCFQTNADSEEPLVSVPPWLNHAMGRAIGWWMNDVFITRDEIGGLMAGLLCTDSPPAGPTRLSAWAAAHADSLGRQYASELARRKSG